MPASPLTSFVAAVGTDLWAGDRFGFASDLTLVLEILLSPLFAGIRDAGLKFAPIDNLPAGVA
ncbi:hypothetical protein HYG81_15055 [Natrinema zhouii]|uniref:Uncharacterized protein n=1 Tax=Natrinema zhouii TaxID=1710539 RepID=A0A7D6CMX8_9EURY|nr:hypothetical protein [Natrinema zhouii]QLK25392.1 hypothetical protein HYG81_15055 [Natrinema zhouii]